MEVPMKCLRLLTAASIIAGFGLSPAAAFNESHVEAVKQGQRDCRWCDLSGAKLVKINLSGANMRGATLQGADLTEGNLNKVDFSGAILTGATMTGVVLTDANLRQSTLNEVDLSGADITGADLQGAYCDHMTKIPEPSEWSCAGVVFERRQ
jgi:uncharacterized protein YjbI with pentapeptide repeats